MKRAVVFDYDSRFCQDIARMIRNYSEQFPDNAFIIDIFKASEIPCESIAGKADVIIHSGGDGEPVKEDVFGVPKLYICHSHQWKARNGGGEVVKLKDWIKGVNSIDIIEDDEIIGRVGKMPIMQYHSLAVTVAPKDARVLAMSRGIREDGEEIDVIEALRYPDGSISIQGHPEEGTGFHIFRNLFERLVFKKVPTGNTI